MNAPSRSVLARGIDACVGIVRFRQGPEDVPASQGLLVAAVAGGVVLRLGMHAIPTPEPATGHPAIYILLDIGITLLSTLLVVNWAGHGERFVQTATAILGCQVVLAPVLIASRWMLLTYFDEPNLGAVTRFFYVLIAAWMMAVVVRILRAATQWPVIACVMVALAVEVFTLLAALSLFPPEAAATGAATATGA